MLLSCGGMDGGGGGGGGGGTLSPRALVNGGGGGRVSLNGKEKYDTATSLPRLAGGGVVEGKVSRLVPERKGSKGRSALS